MKKFPFYKQPGAKDCGPTCLRIISKYYGKVKSRKRLNAAYSFVGFEEMTQGLNEEETIIKLADFLFAVPLQMQPRDLKRFILANNQKEFIGQVCVRLMSLPEYQMC